MIQIAELSEARRKAEKNKDKQRVYLYRSHAKKFVREIANEDDLKELRKMIDDKLNNN